MDEIDELLQSNEITLVITNMKNAGFYVPDLKAMFVNEDLSPLEQKEVILHELHHALNHTDLKSLYKIPVFHSKMENEADKFMIQYLIRENEGQYNYSELLEEFGLPLGWEYHLK
ncbi:MULTISPECIES: ImmA/IrrE family metallo-endopeptidase [Enterococcus]|uniref:ImmA/IrrE family metallo-endopeptidase n=1 Tax=Enterococcus TaxID=1350 RepID=UPI00189CCF3F|nr:ImmA/IrrE family metallo-endopeptidase [Enterococcus dispar]